MSNLYSLQDPKGWLIDPHNKWTIHFYSVDDDSKVVTIDMWGVSTENSPAKFKSRRKTNKTDASKIFNQMRSSGWRNLEKSKYKTHLKQIQAR